MEELVLVLPRRCSKREPMALNDLLNNLIFQATNNLEELELGCANCSGETWFESNTPKKAIELFSVQSRKGSE